MDKKKALICFAIIFIVAGAIGIYFCIRNSPLDPIRIASGCKGGEYYKFGEALKEKLMSKRKGRKVENIKTAGTLENLKLLQDGEVDFAFLQSIVFPTETISIIAPLYLEPVVILAKKESDIASVYDLKYKRVCIGPKRSGTAETFDTLLKFYALSTRQVHAFFNSARNDCDAGIVVMGLHGSIVKKMGTTGTIRMLELPYAQALAKSEAYTTNFTIPKAMFARSPSPLPNKTIQTFAYTALLAVNSENTSSDSINEILDAIYETDIRMKFPDLIPLKEAQNWSDLPLNSTSQEYYNPLRRIEALATQMEAYAGVKELFFAFLAISYFFWLRFNELRKKDYINQGIVMKEELDKLLQETIVLDRKQMQSESPEELLSIIDQINEVKIKALEDLTNEKLRSDQMFSIFLMQCHNLICKIQNKILLLQ